MRFTEEAMNLVSLALRQLWLVFPAVNEVAVPRVGRDTSRRSMGLIDVTALFESRHVVPDRCRRNTELVLMNEHLGTRGFARLNVVSHDRAEHGRLPVVDLGLGGHGCDFTPAGTREGGVLIKRPLDQNLVVTAPANRAHRQESGRKLGIAAGAQAPGLLKGPSGGSRSNPIDHQEGSGAIDHHHVIVLAAVFVYSL
jgi:hypothetical protein